MNLKQLSKKLNCDLPNFDASSFADTAAEDEHNQYLEFEEQCEDMGLEPTNSLYAEFLCLKFGMMVEQAKNSERF